MRPALATQFATCSIALALVKPVYKVFGAATACGNKGDTRGKPVESPGGLSPPGAPRSVREPLDSYGSRCSAVSMTELPVGEECWIYPAEPVKPVSCPLGLPTQPLELAARPADDIEIDPFQGWTQLRLVEVAVVVDPAANARVVHLGQVLQGLVTAMMKRPAPNCSADGRQRLRTGGGQEARKGPTSPSQRFPRPERKPEKVERLVRKVATAVRILAVDDLRLLGMQHPLAGRKAFLERTP